MLPINCERALRAAGEPFFLVADLHRQPCRPALMRVLPPRHGSWQSCAVCRCVAIAAVWHMPRLTQHSSFVRVRVQRVAGSENLIVAPRAAEEAHLRARYHDELHRIRQRRMDDKHRQLLAREGREEHAGACLHADAVPTERLGHVLACLPAWLPVADWLPTSDPHFLWGSHTYPWLT